MHFHEAGHEAGRDAYVDDRDGEHCMVVEGFYTDPATHAKIFKLRNSWGKGSWAELPFDESCRVTGVFAVLTPWEHLKEQASAAKEKVQNTIQEALKPRPTTIQKLHRDSVKP
jgi:hypothetical protein